MNNTNKQIWYMYSSPGWHVGFPTKSHMAGSIIFNGLVHKFDDMLLHRSKNELNYILGLCGG